MKFFRNERKNLDSIWIADPIEVFGNSTESFMIAGGMSFLFVVSSVVVTLQMSLCFRERCLKPNISAQLCVKKALAK